MVYAKAITMYQHWYHAAPLEIVPFTILHQTSLL